VVLVYVMSVIAKVGLLEVPLAKLVAYVTVKVELVPFTVKAFTVPIY